MNKNNMGWSPNAIGDEFRKGIYTEDEVNGAIGNINNPMLDLPLKNSLAMKTGIGSVIFTRGSTATYVDRYGVVKTAQIDEPRFEKEGLLIEGASTNLITYSDNKALGTIFTSQTVTQLADGTAPDGVGHYTNYLKTGSEDGFSSTDVTPLNTTAGSVYNFSMFINVNSHNEGRMEIVIYQSTGDPFITKSISYDEVKDGRLELTATARGDVTSIQCRPLRGIGQWDVDIWGLQFEELPFASSYIPTTSTSLTRLVDNSLLTDSDNIPNVNENFSFVMDVNFKNSSPVAYYLFAGLESGANKLIIFVNSSGKLVLNIYSQDVLLVDEPSGYVRVVFTRNGNTYKIFFNGLEVGSVDYSSNPYLNINEFYIGSRQIGGTGELHNKISNFKTYDYALSKTEVNLA